MARKQLDYDALNNRIVTSGEQFNQAMHELFEASGVEMDLLGRGTMLELYKDLVEKAPKDTGRVAAGFTINEHPSEWVPAIGKYADGESGRKRLLAAVALEQTKKLQMIPLRRSITISNNVEYLPSLENGHSRQAPSGFLALCLQRQTRRLERAAKELNAKRI